MPSHFGGKIKRMEEKLLSSTSFEGENEAICDNEDDRLYRFGLLMAWGMYFTATSMAVLAIYSISF